MKTEYRKFASVIFALCFVFSILPTGVMANESAVEEIPAAEEVVVETVSEPAPAPAVVSAPAPEPEPVKVSVPEPEPVSEVAPEPASAVEEPSIAADQEAFEPVVDTTPIEDGEDTPATEEDDVVLRDEVDNSEDTASEVVVSDVDEEDVAEECVDELSPEVDKSEADSAEVVSFVASGEMSIEVREEDETVTALSGTASGEMPDSDQAASGEMKAEEDLTGDVNLDGRVDYTDARIVITYALYGGSCGSRSMADMNGDGCVDLGDAVLLTRKAAG